MNVTGGSNIMIVDGPTADIKAIEGRVNEHLLRRPDTQVTWQRTEQWLTFVLRWNDVPASPIAQTTAGSHRSLAIRTPGRHR